MLSRPTHRQTSPSLTPLLHKKIVTRHNVHVTVTARLSGFSLKWVFPPFWNLTFAHLSECALKGWVLVTLAILARIENRFSRNVVSSAPIVPKSCEWTLLTIFEHFNMSNPLIGHVCHVTNVWQIVTRFCHARFRLQIIPEQSYNICCWINWCAQTVCSRDSHHWWLDSEYDPILSGVTNPVTKVCHALVTGLIHHYQYVIWSRNYSNDFRWCIVIVSDLPDTQRMCLGIF